MSMQTLDTAEILQKLADLQQTDSGLDEIKKARQNFQDELDRGAAKVDALKKSIQEQKKVQEDLAKQRKTLEIEVGTHETKISKYQNQLLEVKSNKEYDALKMEIEKGKEEKGKLEEKVLECFFKEDEQKQKIQTLSSELQQEEKKAAAEKTLLQDKIGDCEKAIEGKKAEREKKLEGFPPDPLQTYESLRTSGKKMAVAYVQEDQTCSGCHMNVPAQILIEIRRHQRLHHCTCGRFLTVGD